MVRTTPSTTRSSSPTTISDQAAAVRAHVPGRPPKAFPWGGCGSRTPRRGPAECLTPAAISDLAGRRADDPPEFRAHARVRVAIGSAPGGARTERSPAMSGTTTHELSDEERAERRRADREYARQAVEELRSSQGWQRWLAARRHFHAYSFGNQLLIAMARPTATRVAGFRAWLKLGYVVQRGERAIKVWAPCPPSRKQLERWRQAGGDPHQRPRTYFRLVPVFDRLSRVRSGDVADPRGGLRLSCQPRSRCRSSARSGMWEGPGFRLARSSRSWRPEGDGAAAIARASRRYPREQRRDEQGGRERRRRVPKPGISPTDRSRRKAAALHEVEPGARRERSWLHVSGSGHA